MDKKVMNIPYIGDKLTLEQGTESNSRTDGTEEAGRQTNKRNRSIDKTDEQTGQTILVDRRTDGLLDRVTK